MVTCTRQGCGKEFDEASNSTSSCSFHSGAPVFHEGLKSWSCCSGEPGHRAVTSFDEFLAIPGCKSGSHSLEKPLAPVKPPVVASSSPVTTVDGKEVYGAAAAPLPPAPAPVAAQAPVKPVSTVYVEEQDDPEAVLAHGVTCKRKACGKTWEGEDRVGEECQYHPGAPIFHEGSKGYSCCKKRTLDFDDFLAIKGCRTGKHLFAGAKRDETTEELVECRVDHYQTPREVIVSLFGKGADKELSIVKFEAEVMHVDLILPSRKRFTKSFDLYGPINPESSTFKILGTKCEVVLSKADGRSWSALSALDPSLSSNFVAQLAFSAGGGRGTTGSKEPVLDASNKASRGM